MNVEAPEVCSVKSRAINKLKRDMGDKLLESLAHPETTEIILNADGRLWLYRLGKEVVSIGTMRQAQAQALIETVAGFHGKEITSKNPLLEGELPLDGSRFTGQLPPVVHAPTFAIRKKAISIFTLEQYVEQGVMTSEQRLVIEKAVKDHRNILVVGGTGSGKTTLINAIIYQMVITDPRERIIIVEDTNEIQCAAHNCVQYHTTLDIDMTKLIKTTLRMSPDRVLVGEVRGPEALDLLMAWNTGHEGGAATLHANNAKAGLDKLGMYISMHPNSPSPIEPLIADSVHIVVNIIKEKTGRKVNEIIEVTGYENSNYQLKYI